MFENPVTLWSCGHSFCKACVGSEERCQVCGDEYTQIINSRYIPTFATKLQWSHKSSINIIKINFLFSIQHS